MTKFYTNLTVGFDLMSLFITYYMVPGGTQKNLVRQYSGLYKIHIHK